MAWRWLGHDHLIAGPGPSSVQYMSESETWRAATPWPTEAAIEAEGERSRLFLVCLSDGRAWACVVGTKQRLNGCCGAKPQTNFDAQCKFYDKSFNNAHSEKVQYCTTYIGPGLRR